MIFEFPANEFGPRALADVWTLLRSLGAEDTATLIIDETKEGVVTLRLDLVNRKELLSEVVPLLIRLGGVRKEDPKIVRVKFLAGTFDPSEVMNVFDDFATVSTRICLASEPTIEVQWKIGDEVEIKITMEQIVYEDAFLKYFYIARLNNLNAIFV